MPVEGPEFHDFGNKSGTAESTGLCLLQRGKVLFIFLSADRPLFCYLLQDPNRYDLSIIISGGM